MSEWPSTRARRVLAARLAGEAGDGLPPHPGSRWLAGCCFCLPRSGRNRTAHVSENRKAHRPSSQRPLEASGPKTLPLTRRASSCRGSTSIEYDSDAAGYSEPPPVWPASWSSSGRRLKSRFWKELARGTGRMASTRARFSRTSTRPFLEAPIPPQEPISSTDS